MNKFDLQFFGNESGDSAPESTTQPAPGKMFSQAELDQIVTDRLARERKKYEGFDELKTKAAKLDEIEAANKTELEKATRRAEEAEQKRLDAETRLAAKELETAKREALEKAGLAPSLWSRVLGTTPEEIAADVAELAKVVAKAPVKVGDATNPKPLSDETPEQRGKRIHDERAKKKAPTGGYDPWKKAES